VYVRYDTLWHHTAIDVFFFSRKSVGVSHCMCVWTALFHTCFLVKLYIFFIFLTLYLNCTTILMVNKDVYIFIDEHLIKCWSSSLNLIAVTSVLLTYDYIAANKEYLTNRQSIFRCVIPSVIVWSFHLNRLILLRVEQENKSGCFFLNETYLRRWKVATVKTLKTSKKWINGFDVNSAQNVIQCGFRLRWSCILNFSFSFISFKNGNYWRF